MTNNTSLVLALAAIAITLGALVFSFANMPDCRGNEVMVRGSWGYVCVEGHR